MSKPWWSRTPSDILQDGPHYDLQKHLAEVQKLHAKYPWRDQDVCVKKVVDLIDDDTPYCIGENAAEFMCRLFEDDDIFIFHQPTLQYSHYLTRIQKRLTLDHEPSFRAATRFLDDLYRFIPKGDGPFTVPLYDLVDPDHLIALCWNLYSVKHQDGCSSPACATHSSTTWCASPATTPILSTERGSSSARPTANSHLNRKSSPTYRTRPFFS